MIALFRNKSEETKALVQLPLLPPGRFKLHSVLSGKDLRVYSSSDWARGVPIAFSGADRVEVLEVTAA
jgi:hypothetical protein